MCALSGATLPGRVSGAADTLWAKRKARARVSSAAFRRVALLQFVSRFRVHGQRLGVHRRRACRRVHGACLNQRGVGLGALDGISGNLQQRGTVAGVRVEERRVAAALVCVQGL